MKLNITLILNWMLLGVISACGQQSQNEAAYDTQTVSTLKSENYNACKGVTETNFREIFNIPKDYELGDVSAMNVMPAMSCMMAAGKEGKQLAVMVTLMANPESYDLVATRIKEELNASPEEDKIKGLGEFAVYRENRTRKESILVVFQNRHIISVAFDHSNTYSKNQIIGMLQDFYENWLKAQ
ncbi:hypothetical protein MM213_03015 [Belliella sp. R4-6]|uniref:DUF1795 domain-containing protein n=1 Tax=Belliella alkalica TaxID=1730871 RepID=A0ABS9V7P6_9BACT|nr:hypothetical protein [Belliella alkalica]MCH7412441.1 hypothetical protein [Belliella alkalica]